MEYSLQDAINLILDFHYHGGVHEQLVGGLERRFINDGMCEINEDKVFELNKQGELFLHIYISDFTDDLHEFVVECEGEEKAIIEKISMKYEIQQNDAKELIDYLLRNSWRYGYHSNNKFGKMKMVKK